MPIIRKLYKVGGSFAVTLPVSWIKDAEEKKNAKMIEVAMEVNGSIIITPVFNKNKGSD